VLFFDASLDNVLLLVMGHFKAVLSFERNFSVTSIKVHPTCRLRWPKKDDVDFISRYYFENYGLIS
jgi:hypothetical protein